ncbi:MAG TPA: hypothetical protein VGZ47_08905 [Gemmataceae bacterium]|jgi:hypothetical protein|nr:hypothetical protein [Gemmataceae bacterium]
MNPFIYPTEPQFINRIVDGIERARRRANPGSTSDPLPPTREQLESLLSCCFTASLESEERRAVEFTVAFFHEKDRAFPYPMQIPFCPRNLARLSVALDPYRSRICVMPAESGLSIHGLDRLTEHDPFQDSPQMRDGLAIRVLGPGILLVRFGLSTIFTYRRGRVRFWADTPPYMVDNLVRTALSFCFDRGATLGQECSNWLFRRSVRRVTQIMRSHGHGGTLLIVPPGMGLGDRVIPGSGRFAPTNVVTTIKEAFARQLEDELRHRATWEQRGREGVVVGPLPAAGLSSELEWLGDLTGTDGMTVVQRDFTLLGFGVFFNMNDTAEAPTEVSVTDLCNEGPDSDHWPTSAAQIGGARHQSAAITCRHMPGAVAIVASQDGMLTSMTCESVTPPTNVVNAFRHLELLLDF